MTTLNSVHGRGTLASRPAAGTAGAWYFATDDNGGRTYRDNGSSWDLVADGALFKIAESILGSSAASVSFTSIPSTFRSLELYILSRCDNAVTQNNLTLQFNGDTGTNYDTSDVISNNGTVSGAGSIAQTSIPLGWATGANATAGKAAWVKATIFQYAGTTFHKGVYVLAALDRGTAASDQFTWASEGTWLSTAAITSMLIAPAAGNFISGSVFSLYGVI